MKKVFSFITNKFLLTAAAFLAWMVYFDQNDWMAQQSRQQELQDLNDNITYLNTEIGQMEKELEGMNTDPKVLEKYAREQYRMKKDDEDIYIFE
jgi:cell division protein DivIC